MDKYTRNILKKIFSNENKIMKLQSRIIKIQTENSYFISLIPHDEVYGSRKNHDSIIFRRCKKCKIKITGPWSDYSSNKDPEYCYICIPN